MRRPPRRHHLDLAEQCWGDAQVRPELLELLATSQVHAAQIHADYVEACLQDLQVHMDQAWETGEVAPLWEQLHFVWLGVRITAQEAMAA